MAHREKHLQAIDLAEQGKKPPEIARQINAPLRSVQRWLKNHTQKVIDPRQYNNVNTQKCVQIQEMGVDAVCDAEKWLDSLDDILDRHGEIHSQISKRIREKLDAELNRTDASPRTINTLSLALARHLEGEFKAALAGKEKMVEIGEAFKLAIAYGYMILDRDKLHEVFGPEDN